MSIEDNLRTWIDSQGYPLEMRTAEMLRRAGLWWDHGRTYSDPVTGKVREIDLVGDLGSDGNRSVQAILECKHVGKGKPWVMFATDQNPMNNLGFVTQTLATDLMREAIEPAASDDRLHRLIFFERPQVVGFHLVVSHGDNQDAAFHAVSTVVTAGAELARRHSSLGHAVLYVSVVVVDTPLYTCALPDNGVQYELQRVERTTLLHSTGEGRRVAVHVVSIEGFPAFIDAANSGASKLMDLLGPAEPR